MAAGFIQILIGLVLLYFGAEGLVRGSSSLALRLKVSPLVIGLTIVAYGTSMPELVVSLKTALSGQGALSIGNVVGSNIFNIALVLGLSAVVCPLTIQVQLLRFDMPVMIVSALLFGFVFRDQSLSRSEGLLFLLFVGIYTALNFYMASRASKKETRLMQSETSAFRMKHVSLEIVFILAGLGILVLGADQLVVGSVRVARLLGLSEAIIGLTIVAAGTSLPELATSVVAAFRKEQDIAVGNVIGSNIFNILGILGVSSAISPIQSLGVGRVDVLVMIGLSVLIFPFFWSHFKLKRWEGSILVFIYIGYLINLIR